MCIIQLVGPTEDSKLLILSAPYVRLVGRLVGLVGNSAIQLSSTSADPIETKSCNRVYTVFFFFFFQFLSLFVWGNLVNEGPLTPKAQKVS